MPPELNLILHSDISVAAAGCKSCPSGQYGSGAVVTQRIKEDVACEKCVTGKYSKAKGADSNETCIDCQPGIDDWKKSTIKFVIATYGLFTNTSLVAKHVADHEFQFVIVDESHYMKSQNAARTQLLWKQVT